MQILLRLPRAILFSMLLVAAADFGQDGSSPPQENSAPRSEAETFYSGTVADLSAEKVTVSRTILGKPAEQRTFLITPETKVEGAMKTGARVTVRYTAGDQGDVALSILVRNDKQDKK